MNEAPELEIALTGAGGFLGSHVAGLLLARGHRVRALVRYGSTASIGMLAETIEAERARAGADPGDRLRVIHGDVRDPRCVRELVRECDVVLHMAALIGIPYSYRAPESYLETNVRGTLNVLEACREEGPERVVLTSTSEVYGTARRVPMDESHPLCAQSPYAASKIAADMLGESYARSFDLPATILRPFNAYGPRQSARAVVPTILHQALDPRCEAVRLGNLAAVRDLNHAEDVAEGFLAIATAPAEAVVGRVFNMGTGEGRSIAEIAEAAFEATGARKPILLEARRERPDRSEVERLVCDATAFREATGWKPRVPFEEGLRGTAEWVRANLGRFDPNAYGV